MTHKFELVEGTVIEVLADGWVLLELTDERQIRFHRESMRWEPAEENASPHRNGGSDAVHQDRD